MGTSNMTLVKIGAVGGIITVGMGLLARGKIQSNIQNAKFYKESLQIVRSNPGAVQLLGEPIKARSIDVENQKKNFYTDSTAQYEVPLKGRMQRGTLYIWAEREMKDETWKLNRLELEVEKIPNKRLVLKRPESN